MVFPLCEAEPEPNGTPPARERRPPKKNRVDPWEYDREIYKRRNEVERLFRRLKGFRRIFTRYDKLDALFLGFIVFVLIFDALVSVNTP